MLLERSAFLCVIHTAVAQRVAHSVSGSSERSLSGGRFPNRIGRGSVTTVTRLLKENHPAIDLLILKRVQSAFVAVERSLLGRVDFGVWLKSGALE